MKEKQCFIAVFVPGNFTGADPCLFFGFAVRCSYALREKPRKRTSKKQRQSNMAIYLGGSRHLAHQYLVNQVVQSIQASGQVVHVGCCIGADQQVIQAALPRPSSLVVFSQFAPGGQGAWSGSAVWADSKAAAACGSVRYLAGGPLAVPLQARLVRRSQAALVSCDLAL